VLRRERTPVESLDRVAVRFEEVFRHLVNGDGPARRTGSPHGRDLAAAAAEREEVAHVG
jgi:hypothetical protein